ncbi:MAG: ABC transporter ATP-binding protein [Candidatus Sumerlaeia bacterium]
MAGVEIRDVSKVYPGDVRATNHVSIDVRDREFLVLVGPSGCGKSTLLRMIAGLEEITEGEIAIDDRVVNNVAPKDRDIAMVFQNYALYPHMTVYNNMAFGLKLRKFKKDEIDRRVREAAQILGIEELLDRKPKALSGGQRQRVAVGRAIVRQPKVFLFDEPLSNLDAKLRVQMRTEISKLHARLQATMVYVTHDQVEAMTMGERIVVMLDGTVQQCADPITLYEKPTNKFVAGFIGSPPMNFVDGQLTESGGTMYFQEGAFQIELSDRLKKKMDAFGKKNVTMGIRPENIHDPDFIGNLPESAKIEAQVEVIEPMGSETHVHISSGTANIVARLESHYRADMGQMVELMLDMSKAHFFDQETGKTIV